MKSFVYISAMNNAQTHTAMKIQAKDLKAGMDINWGNKSARVSKIEEYEFKNGKSALRVFVTVHAYVVGTGKYRRTIPAGDEGKKIFHLTTWVKLINA